VNYYWNIFMQLDERKLEMEYTILYNFKRYEKVLAKIAELEDPNYPSN